ncbi:MAG: arginase family protein [Ginsengibacter sp.]
MDCLNSGISKETWKPVSKGLRQREAEDLVCKLMQNLKICCFEITEVNPTLDKEDLMSEIVFIILHRRVNVLIMN